LLAATSVSQEAKGKVYNVAVGDRTTLNQLFQLIRERLVGIGVKQNIVPIYRDFREGDVRHSLADIRKAKEKLGYMPTHRLGDGLTVALPWYTRKTLNDA